MVLIACREFYHQQGGKSVQTTTTTTPTTTMTTTMVMTMTTTMHDTHIQPELDDSVSVCSHHSCWACDSVLCSCVFVRLCAWR